MSEHAQALMLSTKVIPGLFSACPYVLILLLQVHATFGRTLMLAGVARIIEICFVAKQLSSLEHSDDDSNSDHTLADTGISGRSPYSSESGSTSARSFRHLPPFVRHFPEQLL
jgi:hypothetical protein